MPDEVTLDVTTIEENVTVETTAGDVVEIQVVAPAGPAGATGPAGPNSVTIATTSDGTGQIMLDTLAVGTCNILDEVVFDTLTYTFAEGSAQALKDALSISFADVSDSQTGTADLSIDDLTVNDITATGFFDLGDFTVNAPTGQVIFGSAAIVDFSAGSTISFDSISYTYGTGAAAAHRTALGLTTLATTTPGTNVATFLATPTSDNLASALTDENGTGGGFVRAEGASLTTPTLVGTPVFNATAYTYGTGAAEAHRDALGVAGKQSKTTTSAVTSTNAVAADISDLTGFVLEANTTYRLTLHSIITTTSGGSFEFFFISSGTTYQGGTSQAGSGIQRSGGVVAGGYHYGTTSFTPLYATQNLTNGHTYGEYYFRTSGTAGTAKMQFSQRSSAIAGTTTVAAGATAILEKIS